MYWKFCTIYGLWTEFVRHKYIHPHIFHYVYFFYKWKMYMYVDIYDLDIYDRSSFSQTVFDVCQYRHLTLTPNIDTSKHSKLIEINKYDYL